MQNSVFPEAKVREMRKNVKQKFKLNDEEVNFFVFSNSITNHTYIPSDNRISILFNDGTTKDISEASDMLNISVLSKVVKKYYLCYPKELSG